MFMKYKTLNTDSWGLVLALDAPLPTFDMGGIFVFVNFDGIKNKSTCNVYIMYFISTLTSKTYGILEGPGIKTIPRPHEFYRNGTTPPLF